MGVYSKPPSQDNDTNELFFEELRDVSKSSVLVTLGHFNFAEIAGNITEVLKPGPEDPQKAWMTALWS